MSSTRNSSPRPQHRKLQSTASKSSTCSSKAKRESDKPDERCRGRCRVQWSEKHVKEGLVLVQEAQLARVVKTDPLSEHYEIDPKPFASGQWARVFRCRSRSTGTLYAAKFSSRNRFNTDCSAELRNEIALLSLCSQSPRVVRLHDVYETPKDIILVMEYAPGGDLQTLIDGDLVPLEGDVVHFVRQLVEALAYLHERNIAHLDIKPQNLVMMGSFPESEVKLCDFEISRVILEGTEVREILGTPDYVAPEIIHYEPITLAADMWSLGITTYVLLTGFSPFGGETDQETFQNISQGEVDFPEELFEDVSAQAQDFVAKLLVLDPSARMSAKQCLRHDWLRDAPTQASPHLRRYLSKSREVLLERVVGRENMRRAALLSQTTSHANLSESKQNQGLGGSLSQSEMCLSYNLTASRGSLTGSECYVSPTDSRTSLNWSQTSLAMSQKYLLNKEQTQGLLSQAQSHSQANINHIARRGLLSRMRSLSQIQSQACLLHSGKATLQKPEMNPLFGSRSQEKLYGLRCLSKSRGVLDIYRSLECLRKKRPRKKDQRIVDEDILPIFNELGNEIALSSAVSIDPENISEFDDRVSSGTASAGRRNDAAMRDIAESSDILDSENTAKQVDKRKTNSKRQSNESRDTEKLKHKESMISLGDNLTSEMRMESRILENSIPQQFMNKEESRSQKSETELNLDSLQSVESDTLTDESDETPLHRSPLTVKQPSQRENNDISNDANNSRNSDEKDEQSESENEEPKYTVAQLVSAFNKRQEVATQTSLEAIMTEKRVNEVTFPTGPKALILFVPDINITEHGVVRGKTSCNPRTNREDLGKQNDKNEGVSSDFDNDSRNQDADEETDDVEGNPYDKAEEINLEWPNCENSAFNREVGLGKSLGTRIDEKYKQCVDGVKSSRPYEARNSNNTETYRQKERLPNYILSDVTCPRFTELDDSPKTTEKQAGSTRVESRSIAESRSDSTVNLKDILQKNDATQRTSKRNQEKLRKRTSTAKIILNDNLVVDNDGKNNGTTGVNRANSEPSSAMVKLDIPSVLVRSSSLSSESSCPTSSGNQSDIGMSWEDVHGTRGSRTSLEKDECKIFPKREPVWETSKPEIPKSSTGENRLEHNRMKTTSMTPEERQVWGKVCTGTYTRAMEKFNGKQSVEGARRSNISLSNAPQYLEKTRRKSSTIVPQKGES